METQLKFFKKDGKWYADVPNRTLEENEMVMGTDVILDMIKDSNDQVTLKLSDEEVPKSLLILKMLNHDENGAYYSVSGPVYDIILRQLSEKATENDDTFQYLSSVESVWICNVTHDVFGEHPESIYVTKIIQHFDEEHDKKDYTFLSTK